MDYVTLNNGVKMPQLGYGVYQTPTEETESCVLTAIKNEYRSIDTAQAYGNEEGVGQAIVKCGLPREELFITTKIWISNAGYEKAKASIEESLKKLKTDYVDLLLIHQPFGDYYGTYRAMEEAYKAGKARAIGVSNFYRHCTFCRSCSCGKSGGNTCVPAAESGSRISCKISYTDYELGTVCRRKK